MNSSNTKLKAIGISFLDGVLPSLIIVVLFVLVYLMYIKVYRALMIDTINVYSVIGTILILPSGIFVLICFLSISYSFFRIGLNQAVITFSFGNEGGFSIYEVGDRFVSDDGTISIMQLVLGMFLFVLIIPFSLLLWIIRVVRIVFSNKYAEAICSCPREGLAKMAVPSLIGVGACVFGLLVFGLKGIQDANYNPYEVEPYINELSFYGKNDYSASLSFDFNVDHFGKAKQINGTLSILNPETKKEIEYKNLHIADGKEYLAGFTISLNTGDIVFREMYKYGFEKLDYYFKVNSVGFDIGTTELSDVYVIELSRNDFTYTSNGYYVFN